MVTYREPKHAGSVPILLDFAVLQEQLRLTNPGMLYDRGPAVTQRQPVSQLLHLPLTACRSR